MTRLYWVKYSTQSVLNVCIKFDTWKENWKPSILEENNVVLNEKKCWEKTI